MILLRWKKTKRKTETKSTTAVRIKLSSVQIVFSQLFHFCKMMNKFIILLMPKKVFFFFLNFFNKVHFRSYTFQRVLELMSLSFQCWKSVFWHKYPSFSSVTSSPALWAPLAVDEYSTDFQCGSNKPNGLNFMRSMRWLTDTQSCHRTTVAWGQPATDWSSPSQAEPRRCSAGEEAETPDAGLLCSVHAAHS